MVLVDIKHLKEKQVKQNWHYVHYIALNIVYIIATVFAKDGKLLC